MQFIYPVIFLVFFIISSFTSFAQDIMVEDTVKIESSPEIKRHSVKRAVSQSAIVPGWGQIYNRKYWKLPIIYAGFGGLGFAIGFNVKKWNTYREAYRLRVDGDSTTIDNYVGIYNDGNLLTLKNFYKRNLDLAVIFTAVLYALNIIDAAVDAHLFDFDISDDLTMRVQPVIRMAGNPQGGFTGITLTLRL